VKKRNVVILGATGSIGDSALQLLSQHRKPYRVFALAARQNARKMLRLCLEYEPSYAVMHSAAAAAELEAGLARGGADVRVLAGAESLCAIAAHEEADIVLAAIVGLAGLPPTLAAAGAGKRILLANKEAVVAGGEILLRAVAEGGAELLPVDSEHSAVFQCLPRGKAPSDLRRVVLTASGGPLRTLPLEALAGVTPEQACAHPTWDMGAKISVDSATLMNKGLEWIEARRLFDLAPEQVEILIHPQSILHALVEFGDGSVLAQLANPDMRLPLAAALAWPRRMASGIAPLDLAQLGRLEFETPSLQRFPCLGLAMAAGRTGGDAPTALNAANEVAVEAFLSGRLEFTGIPAIVERGLAAASGQTPQNLSEVEAVDAESRRLAREGLRRRP